MAAQIAENYQLKWHSHLSNLNSSVATLYRNEKYADVLLFTSNSDGGTGIPAHKLILGSCSHFFANIFDANPSPPNSMIYIVLPPELSKRSLQILIQYMYSGEATVSNDILNEVLRGGEVLKIRGLWRNSNESSASTSSSVSSGHHSLKMDHCTTLKENPVIVEKPVYENRPERSNSSAVIKESPVIVMSPQLLNQQCQLQQQAQQQVQSAQTQQHRQTLEQLHRQPLEPIIRAEHTHRPTHEHPRRHSNDIEQSHQPLHIQPNPPPQQGSVMPPPILNIPSQSLLVKAENSVQTDNQNPVPALHFGLVSLQIAAAVKKAQLNTESRIKSTQQENGPAPLRRFSVDQANKEIESSHQRSKDSDVLRMAEKQRLSSDEQPRIGHHLEPGEKSRFQDSVTIEKKTPEVQIPEALSFLTIKEEPVEWTDYDVENGIEKSQIEVKPEIVYSNEENEEEEEHDEMVYSPLTCELCSEVFTVPAEWVRHIEGHAEVPQCVPKKRKRVDETTSDNIAALRCDLCSMYFVTPAEWVRHVQNTHTETELALSNNSSPPKRNQRTIRPLDGQPLEKTCSTCKKSFPSYASMVIHKRTHTGERPFYCTQCDKGFNVKSNLLRHMRTLHNKLLLTYNPPTIIDCHDEQNPE